MDSLDQVVSASRALPTVSGIDSKRFKKHYLDRRTPVLLKGFANGWEATRKWNIEFFYEFENTRPVVVEIGNVLQSEPEFLNQDFKHYINALKQSELNQSENRTYYRTKNCTCHKRVNGERVAKTRDRYPLPRV